jgi:hypothetical protein
VLDDEVTAKTLAPTNAEVARWWAQRWAVEKMLSGEDIYRSPCPSNIGDEDA